MGLFSTLGSSNDPETTSSKIPTVVQLYVKDPIQLDSTSMVNGYTAMTYQAVQVGSFKEDEVKNRHQNPDLGVWSCLAREGDYKQPMIDALLTQVCSTAHTYCLTVNLADETAVEPHLTLIQGALVRHLIGNPPTEAEEVTVRKTATTSLYQLQATQFGLAVEDKKAPKNINEAYKDIKTTVMICAVLPQEGDEVSEAAFRKKQGKALIIYHLRKFAASINASLCFVEEESPESSSSQPPSPNKESMQSMNVRSSAVGIHQPTVTQDKLAQIWRDLALDKTVWLENETTADPTAAAVAADAGTDGAADEGAAVSSPDVDTTTTALFGPGTHQEEIIDTILLRNAHYPGHWEAQKDSLWVALPTISEDEPKVEGPPPGDEAWLTQLRNSIVPASDTRKVTKTPDKPKPAKPQGKDVAVSSFFESLLKSP